MAENQANKGGGQLGQQGRGRPVFRAEESDEVKSAEVLLENCPNCECRLDSQTSNERAIYDLQREEIRQIYYEIRRKRCPKCREIYAGKVANVMANAKLSNDLIVEVDEQHYILGRTLGQLSERFGVNYAMLSEALRRVGKMLEPSLERLKRTIEK